MNFLAHLFLSYPDKEEMTGNFIGDFVKGKQFEAYPPQISYGIKLHRRIDEFTDKHRLVREVNQIFRVDFKRYAGVVSDITFDHLLAKYWHKYHSYSLDDFANFCYVFLKERIDVLPERVQTILPRIIESKRLQSYESLAKTAEAIEMMSKFRTFYFDKKVYQTVVESELIVLEDKFFNFFEDLRQFVQLERASVNDRL